ncbi:MAG TPA: cupin domain-containing protein [Candidatus Dormibacteraeota bacterium]|nr:cupin domain-containing protein [Candidatus Dormibacteraeota bacterium]
MSSITQLDRSEAPEAALRSDGLSPYPWSAGPGAVFSHHSHSQTKHLYVLRGSIDFDGVELGAGDGILIPADTEHSAVAGPSGVTCVEAFED